MGERGHVLAGAASLPGVLHVDGESQVCGDKEHFVGMYFIGRIALAATSQLPSVSR